jgi:hypothetical protein
MTHPTTPPVMVPDHPQQEARGEPQAFIAELRGYATDEVTNWMADPANEHYADRKPEDHIAWKASVWLQAIFDPENQPSQFGTILLPSPTGDSEAGMSEDQLVELIHRWFTEEWRSDLGDKWKEDVLLTGCRKVGNGRGYQNPEEAAANLRRDLARAILAAHLRAQPPQPTGDVGELVAEALRHANIDLSFMLGHEGEIPVDVREGFRTTLGLIDKATIAAKSLNSRIASQEKELRDYRAATVVYGMDVTAEELVRAFYEAKTLREAAKGQLVVVNAANARAEQAEQSLRVAIDRTVEFCLTHTEHYSVGRSDDSVKLYPTDHYWLTIKPDRVKPGELLPMSAEHRQKRIEVWKQFARAALSTEAGGK